MQKRPPRDAPPLRGPGLRRASENRRVLVPTLAVTARRMLAARALPAIRKLWNRHCCPRRAFPCGHCVPAYHWRRFGLVSLFV